MSLITDRDRSVEGGVDQPQVPWTGARIPDPCRCLCATLYVPLFILQMLMYSTVVWSSFHARCVAGLYLQERRTNKCCLAESLTYLPLVVGLQLITITEEQLALESNNKTTRHILITLIKAILYPI